MSALDDRRQSAVEAGYDVAESMDETNPQVLDAAIETATRVRITPEIEAALLLPHAGEVLTRARLIAGLRHAFEAAGFEVEE